VDRAEAGAALERNPRRHPVQPPLRAEQRLGSRLREPILTEDCLSISVYTPHVTRGRLPVVVWIHGGGFSGGAGQDTNPRKFIQQANTV